MSRLILAIDLGTGGPKAALFTERGERVGVEFEAIPLALRPGGGAEQNPDDCWWNAIKTATRRVMARTGARPDQIAAVANTTT